MRKKIWMRFTAVMLTLTLAAGIVPPDLQLLSTPVHAEGTTVYKMVSESTKESQYKNDSSYVTWLQFCVEAGMSGQYVPPDATVQLEEDIVVKESEGNNIPSRAYFKGTFEGQGHTLTLAPTNQTVVLDLKEDTNVTGTDIMCSGLFSLLEGGRIRDLTVRLNDGVKVQSNKGKMVMPGVYYYPMFIGLLAGQATAGSTIERCTLLAGSNAALVPVSTYMQSGIVSVGALVGNLEGSVSGCYSQVSIEAQLSTVPLTMIGGLVGRAGSAAKISDSTVQGAMIDRGSYTPPSGVSGYVNYLGGIVGGADTNSSLTNLFSGENTTTNNPGDTGQIIGAYDGAVNNGIGIGNTGFKNSSFTNGSISALISSGQWVYTQKNENSWPNLKRLVSPMKAPAVKVELANQNTPGSVNKITFTPAAPEIAGEDSWQFKVQYPAKGRQPTPAGAKIAKNTDGASALEWIADARAVGTTGSQLPDGNPLSYYPGATYQFWASMTGVEKAVTWSVDPVAQGKGVTIQDGKVTLPLNYDGAQFAVSANDGASTKSFTVAANQIKMPAISIADGTASIEKGQSASFTANVSNLGAAPAAPTVQWEIMTAGVQSATAFNGNTLTVAANETNTSLQVRVTVSGEFAQPLTATKTITLTDAPRQQLPAVTATPASGSLAENAEITLSNESNTTIYYTTDGTADPTPSWNGSAWTGGGTVYSTPILMTTSNLQIKAIAVSNDNSKDSSIVSIFNYSPATGGTAAAASVQPDASAQSVQAVQALAAGTQTGVTFTTSAVEAPLFTGTETVLLNSAKGVIYKASVASYTISLQNPAAVQTAELYWLISDSASASAETVQTVYVSPFVQSGLSTGKVQYLHLKTAKSGDRQESAVLTYQIVLTGANAPYLTRVGTTVENSGGVAASTKTTQALTYDATKHKDGYPFTDFLAGDELAQGDVKVFYSTTGSYYQGSDETFRRALDTTRSPDGSATVAGSSPSPIIRPSVGEVISESEGIWIEKPASVQSEYYIYYTITPDGTNTAKADPEVPEVIGAVPPEGSRTHLFRAGDKIAFPVSSSEFEVRAVGIESGKGASNVVSTTYKSNLNLSKPAAPRLLIGDNKVGFQSQTYYVGGDVLHFSHARLAQGKIYYTINGQTPTEYDSIVYDPAKPSTLSKTAETVRVQAYFYDNEYKLQSDIVTFDVRIRQRLSLPMSNTANQSLIRPSQNVYFTIGNLAQVETTNQVEMISYNEAVKRDAALGIQIDAKPQDVTGDPDAQIYVTFNETAGEPVLVPELYALITNSADAAGDILANGSKVNYGVRRVIVDATGKVTNVKYTQPEGVAIGGNAGDKMRVQVMTKAVSSTYDNSETATFFYTIRAAVGEITSAPADGSAVKIGDTIGLICKTPNTAIYYTDDNTQPEVNWDGSKWVTGGTTKLLDKYIHVASDDASMLIVHAVAVSRDFSLESYEKTFAYNLSTLPPADAPTATVPSDTQQTNNTKLQFSTNLVSGKIYYTTDGSMPQVERYRAWEADPAKPEKPADLVTEEYNTQTGIVMQADAANPTFIVTALVYDTAQPQKYSTSLPKQYIYNLRQATAPTASPATSIEAPIKLKNGDKITLTTKDANVDIYYTTDGSVPAAAEGGATKKYDPVTGIAMQSKSATDYFIINAIAASDDYAASSVSRFSYALESASAPAALPATTPESPTPLKNGDKITFNTKNSGLRIYYTDDGTLPQVPRYQNTGGAVVWDEPSGSTKLYNAQTGVLMHSASLTEYFVLNAVAVSETYAQSENIRFVYALAQAAAPTAVPTTSTDQVATVSPGAQINLFSTSSGVKIYYTLDNSMPNSTAYRPENDVSGSGTMLYDAAKGILMPENITTFLSIRAIASNGTQTYADSAPAQFVYQPPLPVQAVLATPNGSVDGLAVLENSQVALSCTTPGASIYYDLYPTKEAALAAADPTTTSSQLYSTSNPILITKATWVKAMAVSNGAKSAVSVYGYQLAPKLTAPAFSLPTGSIVAKGTRVLLSADAGATIAYTIDGTDPKAAVAKSQSTASSSASGSGSAAGSVMYGRNLVVDAAYGETVTVRAYAYRDGYTPSEIASYTYTVAAKEEALSASPQSGTVVNAGETVSFITSLTNARIFYTVNGDTPQLVNLADAASGDYRWGAGANTYEGSSVSVNGAPGATFTIKGVAIANGAQGATPQVFTYKLAQQTAAPTADVPSGAITMDGLTVRLIAKEGAIYYTTDGSNPTTSSRIYTDPVAVDKSMVLKAIAVADQKIPSEIVQYHYTRAGQVAAPTFSVAGGEIEANTKITLTCATQGANIYYSTDNTDPTDENLQNLFLYDGPISVTRPVTVRAFATLKGLHSSVASMASYQVIDPPPAEEETPQTESPKTTVTDRLTSRRTFSDSGAGASYPNVFTDPSYNLLVSGPDESIPRQSKLVVKEVSKTASEENTLKERMGYSIVSLYDVQLENGGEAVQPTQKIEMGIPIPSDYQNAIVVVCGLNDDGTVEMLSTRRAGGVAYAEVNRLGKYAVTVPQTAVKTAFALPVWLLALVAASAALFVVIVVLVIRKRKKEA